jgi:squalene synthase HpnC
VVIEKRYSLSEAREFCRRFTRSHSENFSVATLFLPRRLLPHFYAIYAYCRFADDLGDESASEVEAIQKLAWWRSELLSTYAGEPRHPIMVALDATIHRFAIPSQPFLDLISAFEQDQSVKRYDTCSQLLGYCRRSADPVGRILLYLFECFDEKRAELSDRICTALQLTNFWQDVARDFDMGRVYLPREDCEHFRYSAEDLQAKRFTPQFAALMRFEVARARDLFERGLPLVDLVPRTVRTDIELFARGGLAILRKIEGQGYNVWQRRPRLSKFDKARLMLGVLARRWRWSASPR